MAKKSGIGGHLRSNIQAQMEQAEEEHRRELFRKRIELAKAGLMHYEERKITDAVNAFRTYLKILEEFKKVPEGGLQPSLFDMKKDLPEMLLISGIFWDLSKIYDRTTSKAKHGEFKQYLNKFIIFSKGMPYQGICAETIRKYIAHEKPVHKEDFKIAYKRLATSRCFVATSLIDVSHAGTVPRLRNFRDRVLVHSVFGRRFVGWYYRHGPGIAAGVDRLPMPVRRALGVLVDFAGLATTVISSGQSRSARDGNRTRCG